MKNISDLFLLMVITFVFLQRKKTTPHFGRETWFAWLGAFSKPGLKWPVSCCDGHGSIPPSRQGLRRVEGSARGALGEGGGCAACPSPARLGEGATGSGQAHLGALRRSPARALTALRGNASSLRQQVRALRGGKPHEKPFRGQLTNLG